ncbi:restriction endonuclease subunit S [Exiguobacterium profundum]|uniref:restriction endonuclease subunit S n=1 Tax=Exiguobacterium profundum TaxID=307643 RepID=UPI0033909210
MSVDTSIWYENLPDKWISKKLKYIVDLRNEKIVGGEIQNYIGLENIESKTGKFLPSINSEINIEGISNQFYKGDILFGKLRPYLAKCIEAEFDGVGTTELLALKGNTKLILSKYLKFMMLSPKFIDYINSSTYGTKMPRASWDFIGNIEVPLPSINHQQRIIDFITSKVSSVDKLLLQKKHLINLLEQQRQSIITEAVTKGLNPNVKMKDSGVEWIGEIPEHWETKALKYCFKVGNGKEIDVELDIENESGINVYGSGGIFKKTNKVLFEGESVLFGRKGTIGKPLYVNDVFWTVDTMYYTEFYKKSYPKWFYYLLLVYPWDLIITQTALPSVVGSDVANTICAIPSFGEQVEIAEYLSLKDEKHFKLVENINNQIQKLKEYRQALIYEAVTGKIDVREMEID